MSSPWLGEEGFRREEGEGQGREEETQDEGEEGTSPCPPGEQLHVGIALD